MRKFLVFFLSLLVIFFQSGSLYAGETPNSVNVLIDGVVQNYETTPIIQNSSVLVPMRSIFETLGAEVGWEESTKTVKAARDDCNIQITIGSLDALKNGESVKLAAEPILVNNVTMVPLRFVSEALGALVDWDQNSRTVSIISNEKESDISNTSPPVDTSSPDDLNQSDIPSAADILTYEQAVELALKNSYNLKNVLGNVKRAEELRDQAYENYRYAPVGVDLPPGTTHEDALSRAALLGLVQADTAWQMARKQVGTLEEMIAFQVRGAYDEILKKINGIKVADIAIKNAETELDMITAKVQNGMESKFNLTNARNTYNEEKLKRELLNKQLDEAYLDFNQLLGIGNSHEYQLLGRTSLTREDVNLDVHICRVFEKDPNIWLQEQKIKMADMSLKLYTFNVGMEPYSVKEIDVKTEKYNLASLKERIEEITRSRYYQMKQLEDQFAILEINLAKAEEYLRLVTTQYNLGMAVKSDLEQAELAAARLKTEMQNLVMSHETLRILFNTPWVVPYQ